MIMRDRFAILAYRNRGDALLASSRTAVTLRLVLLAAFVSGCVSTAASQIVRGTVLDSTTHQPVSDFIVSLVDDSGRVGVSVLASDAGNFLLRAPSAGHYRLRLQRIGYRSTVSEPFALASSETVIKRLAVLSIRVTLTAVRVTGRQACVINPRDGMAAAALWDEAQKVLLATQLVQSERSMRLTVRDFERDLSRDIPSASTRVFNERSDIRTGISESPYYSLSPAVLERDGYTRVNGDSSAFFAPDAAVLLSDEFARSHCLRVQGGAAEGALSTPPKSNADDLVGLAFEPVRSRSVPDIRGVLWLDRRSAELRRLDYQYVGLDLPPVSAGDTSFGGQIEIRSMGGGAWIIRRWQVRAPVVRLIARQKLSDGGGLGTMRVAIVQERTIVAAHEEGGEVIRAATADGMVLWSVAKGQADDLATIPATAEIEREARASPDGDSSRCVELQRASDHLTDSALAVPVALWQPSGADAAESIRGAQAVAQVVIDAEGVPQMNTFRVVRSQSAVFGELARRQLAIKRFPVAELVAGCRLRKLIVVPFHFSAGH